MSSRRGFITAGWPARSIRRRRGSVFVFFIGSMIPMIMLAMMLAVDVTRIIDAQRQAAYVAENSAISATLQYSGQTTSIDTVAANREARRTAQVAFDRQVMKHAASPRFDQISFRQVRGADTATVTISYRINRLLVAQYFLGQDTERLQVSRSAQVCVADTDASRANTGGFCSRPRARLG